MSKLALGDGILHTCNICNETFDNRVNFTEHSKIHVNMETVTDTIEKQTTTRKRRKKKKIIKYCHICCKSFASAASCSQHMKHFHDTLTASKYGVPFKKIRVDSTQKDINYDENSCTRVCIDDIFLEFEKKLPFEFKHDICICTLCGIIFKNIQDYLNHEIIHYQVMEMQVQVPVQVQVSVPMSVPMPVQVQMSMPMSIPMPVQVKMLTDESTSSTDNKDIFNKVICNICKCTFTTNLDFEEHKNRNCERVEQKTPVGGITNIKKEHELLCNSSDVVVIEKSASLNILSDDHINACKELYKVKQQFYCDICHKTCENSDHFEIIQWWNAPSNYNRTFKCIFCLKTFSEKAALKLHKTEHLKI